MGEILMKNIDIVTTATLRPDILHSTLNSFTKNIFKDKSQYRFIINIDPVGDMTKSKDDVIAVAKKYFDDVVVNSPKVASFPKAVMWLWENTSADYIFHLEDDWMVNREIDISDMVNILEKYPSICTVRLSKGVIGAGGKILKPYKCKFAREEDRRRFKLFPRISLNPTLIRGSFAREAVKVMTPDINPESQLVYGWARRERNFQSDRIDKFLEGWEYSVYTACGENPVVADTGRKWRGRMRINRDYDFVKWS